jgi:uncharacterized protein YjiS (DUF1127 family)
MSRIRAKQSYPKRRRPIKQHHANRTMKESAMILATLRQRHALRQSIGSLLRRSDDHLLEDIGLTRCEVQSLIADSAPAQPKSGYFAPFHA